MKKTKIIAILSAFVIVTSMVGVAAANMIYAANSGGTEVQTFYNGDTVYAQGLGLTDPSSGNCKVYVVLDYKVWPDATSSDTVNIAAVTTIIHTTTTTVAALNNYPSGVSAGVVPTDIPYGEYDLVYDSDGDGVFEPADGDRVDQQVCCGFSAIPEFATIAIPVIGILGLFLFFNHRKRKEE